MTDFDKKLQKYLSTPEELRDIAEGATLLLQLNRNRILYNNVLVRPNRFAKKLFYELDKYANNRAIAQNKELYDELAAKVDKVDVKAEEEKNVGIRSDHEKLPAEIQQLYVDNAPLLGEMRSLHEKLKLAKQPCDRIEIMQILLEKHDVYKSNWEVYDNYKEGDALPSEVIKINEKSIGNWRAYISKNKSVLEQLKADPEAKADYLKWLAKIQQRVDNLIAANEDMTPEYQAELAELGVQF